MDVDVDNFVEIGDFSTLEGVFFKKKTTKFVEKSMHGF